MRFGLLSILKRAIKIKYNQSLEVTALAGPSTPPHSRGFAGLALVAAPQLKRWAEIVDKRLK